VNRYRWVILAAGTFAQATFSAITVGLPALAPVIRTHYHLSLARTGIALGAASFGMLATLLAWGLLADRIGERAVMATGLTGAGFALVCIPLTHGYGALLALLALTGALGASINAASGRAVIGWFRDDQRGLALGIRQTAVPIGGATAAAVLPLLAPHDNPSHAFLALGAGCLAGAAVAAALVREPPVQDGPVLVDVGGPFRDLRNWLLAGGSGLFVVAQIAATTYATLFLHQHRGLSTHSAALVLAAMNVLAIGARIGSGRWSDHRRARIAPLRILGLWITAGTTAVALLVDAPLWAIVPALVVAGVFSLSWNGVAFTAAAEGAGLARSGAALGFQQTVLGVILAVAVPAFAALVAATSWRTAFAVSAACPLVGVLVLLRVREATAGVRRRGTSAIPPAAR
jgi:sugar phosphate permease